jgi:hypothetical protein
MIRARCQSDAKVDEVYFQPGWCVLHPAVEYHRITPSTKLEYVAFATAKKNYLSSSKQEKANPAAYHDPPR